MVCAWVLQGNGVGAVILQRSCPHEHCQLTHQASLQPQPPLHSTTVAFLSIWASS